MCNCNVSSTMHADGLQAASAVLVLGLASNVTAPLVARRRGACWGRVLLMLNASRRVVAAEGSGLIDLHAPRVVDHADGATMHAHILGLAGKLSVRVSRGSVTLSSCTQTQRSC